MDREIRDCIRQAAGTFQTDDVSLIDCEVVSVDLDNRVCDCKIISGDADNEIPNVRLSSDPNDGFILVPATESTVTVALSKHCAPVLVMISEVDSVYITAENNIIFNNGSFGGLTKTQELKIQLDKTNQLLTAILNIINGSPINEPGNGSPSALQAALKAAITGKSLGDYSNIENTRITHG